LFNSDNCCTFVETLKQKIMKQEALQLTGGLGKGKRRELDFYPTPANVTISLLDFLHAHFYITSFSKVWEPACGNGAMSRVIEKYCKFVYSTDLNACGYGVSGIDYLTHESLIKFDAIITNPPFNLSEAFIKKALSEAPLVCILLKSQYWHAKSRYTLFMDNPPAYILPLTWRPDFLEHEKGISDKKGAPTMEVLWTVWARNEKSSKYIPLLKP
jgi:hypothetical protein